MAEKNPYLRTPIDVVKQLIEIPPPAPDQPGLFRLAKPGDLSGMAKAAGLEVLADDEITGESPFHSVDEYFTSLMDIAAPIQALFAKLTPTQRTDAEAGIKRAAGQYRRGTEVALPMAVRIVVGRKPS